MYIYSCIWSYSLSYSWNIICPYTTKCLLIKNVIGKGMYHNILLDNGGIWWNSKGEYIHVLSGI